MACCSTKRLEDQQDKISISKLYDPNIQVKRKHIFKNNDPILEEIVNEIKNDQSLVWNRAGKPTHSGFQTHELFKSSHNSNAISQLMNKLTKLLLETPRKEQERLTGGGQYPLNLVDGELCKEGISRNIFIPKLNIAEYYIWYLESRYNSGKW